MPTTDIGEELLNDRSPTSSSDDTLKVKQEYIQWQNMHAKMKDSPPPDGRDYLKHAKILLMLLDGASELHPFAKSVITSFKTVVMFEQDRRENDARVTSVFLAQTDMMRVLLDVDDISTRRQNRSNTGDLRSSITLGNVLLAVQREIKSCGNSIDTYYKESRFVKFWKAQDWKERMLGHIGEFDNLRLQLQQTLSLQVASGVQDLVSKMDIVLSRLFTPKYDWEKDLDAKTRGFGASNSWIHNTTTLQTLISGTNDPLLPLPSPADTADMSTVLTTEMLLSKVKKELEQSLDTLCEKNVDMFELKLNFHTQQMEKTIIHSAHFVIQSLSGPSERLVNEDLKQLWKEMAGSFFVQRYFILTFCQSWLFCIENKIFGSALFEFYLDRFSSNRRNISYSKEEVSRKTEEGVDADPIGLKNLWAVSVPAPKFTFLSRLGFINHPDSWTLEYIARHGERITQAIDNDSSGFIRISEANTFTEQIPKGWNLPQWCAYSAAGWAYEARIYRRRIKNITSIITEMQAHVLDTNRTYLVVFSLVNFLTICHAFTREPIEQDPLILAPELCQLVKEKVYEQDTLYRGHLQSLRWTLEDESTIHLLYGEVDPEKYVLQLCTLMLEQFLALVYICRKVTIDIGEWMRLSSAFRVIRGICVKRIFELEARFKDNNQADENVAAYRGGIWSYFIKVINRDAPLTSSTFIPYSRQEMSQSLSDASILNDFPISHIMATTSPYLQYTPWEEYVKTVDEAVVPSIIPRSWNSIDETLPKDRLNRTSTFSTFPFTGSKCDMCNKPFESTPRYTCMDLKCFDFDMCKDCYRLAETGLPGTIPHEFQHNVIFACLLYMPDQQQRIGLEIDDVLEHLQQQYNAQQRSNTFINAGPIPQENQNTPQQDNTPQVVETSAEDTEDTQKPRDGDDIPQENKDASQETADGLEEKGDPIQEGENDPEAENGAISRALVTENQSSSMYKQFQCGRCNDSISLESDFYRCVGHSCQDYYVCEKCAMGEHYEANDNEHQWWHTLLCLRKDMITGNHSEVHPSTETVESEVVQNDTKPRQTPVSSETVDSRISKIEGMLDLIHTSHFSLETKRDANVERLEANVGRLEAKVERLEAKMDDMMAAIRQLLAGNLIIPEKGTTV